MSVGGVLQSVGVRGLSVWLAVMATLHSKPSRLAKLLQNEADGIFTR